MQYLGGSGLQAAIQARADFQKAVIQLRITRTSELAGYPQEWIEQAVLRISEHYPYPALDVARLLQWDTTRLWKEFLAILKGIPPPLLQERREDEKDEEVVSLRALVEQSTRKRY